MVHLHVRRTNCFAMYRESAYFLRPGVMIMPIVLMEQMKLDVEHLGKIKLVAGEEMVSFVGIFNLWSILESVKGDLSYIHISSLYHFSTRFCSFANRRSRLSSGYANQMSRFYIKNL